MTAVAKRRERRVFHGRRGLELAVSEAMTMRDRLGEEGREETEAEKEMNVVEVRTQNPEIINEATGH